MAEFTTSVDPSKELTIHTVVGEVTAAEIYDRIREALTGKPTRFVIWDYSDADLSGLTKASLEPIVDLNKALGASRRGGKTAVVGPSDLAYGLGRQFETLMELREAPFELQVFRSIEGAKAWFGIDQPPP